MDPADARREIKRPVRVSLPPMTAPAWATWLGLALRTYERLGFTDNGKRHPLRDDQYLTIQIMVTALG